MTFEQKFKALKPQDKDSQNDFEDLKLALEGEADSEWQDEFEHFIKRYPDSISKEKKEEPKKEELKYIPVEKTDKFKVGEVYFTGTKDEFSIENIFKVGTKFEITINSVDFGQDELTESRVIELIKEIEKEQKKEKITGNSRIDILGHEIYFHPKNEYGEAIHKALEKKQASNFKKAENKNETFFTFKKKQFHLKYKTGSGFDLSVADGVGISSLTHISSEDMTVNSFVSALLQELNIYVAPSVKERKEKITEVEKKHELKKVYIDLSKSDEITKHTFLLGKKSEEYRLHRVPTNKPTATPKSAAKATKVIDQKIERTIGKTTNFAQKVIKASPGIKNKEERQAVSKKVNNLLMIYGSALNEKILKADIDDLNTIIKGLETIVLHVLNEEDLMKFFEYKPLILDAAERANLVVVQKDKNKILSIKHKKADSKAIELTIDKKDQAVKTFGKGGRI